MNFKEFKDWESLREHGILSFIKIKQYVISLLILLVLVIPAVIFDYFSLESLRMLIFFYFFSIVFKMIEWKFNEIDYKKFKANLEEK